MSIFREAPVDGKPGPVSLRRVAAGALICDTIVVSVVFALRKGELSWQAAAVLMGIPLAGAIILLVCTTVADIVAIFNAVKGDSK